MSQASGATTSSWFHWMLLSSRDMRCLWHSGSSYEWITIWIILHCGGVRRCWWCQPLPLGATQVGCATHSAVVARANHNRIQHRELNFILLSSFRVGSTTNWRSRLLRPNLVLLFQSPPIPASFSRQPRVPLLSATHVLALHHWSRFIITV